MVDKADLPYYVAGPMTGIKSFNYPAFDEAAASLRARGFFVISPSEIIDPELRAAALRSPDGNGVNFARDTGYSWTDALVTNLRIVAEQVRGLILLPGWESSAGTRTELFVAELVRLPVHIYPELEQVETKFDLRWAQISPAL